MRPVAPRIPGADEYAIAQNQLDYMEITVAILRTPGCAPVRFCRWTLTPEERAAVAAGADIYLATDPALKLMPHYLQAGYP